MLQEENGYICIVNINCLNLKTRFDQLKLFLADTDFHKYQVLHYKVHTLTNILTWHSTQYLDILDAYRISSHCGVAIYHNNDFSHERTFINSTSTVFESVTIKMWKNDTIASKYF